MKKKFTKIFITICSAILLVSGTTTIFAQQPELMGLPTKSGTYLTDSNGQLIPLSDEQLIAFRQNEIKITKEKETLKQQIEENNKANQKSYLPETVKRYKATVTKGTATYATKPNDISISATIVYNSTLDQIQKEVSTTTSRTYSVSGGAEIEFSDKIKGLFEGNYTYSAERSDTLTFSIRPNYYGWIQTEPLYINKWGYIEYEVIEYATGKVLSTGQEYFDAYSPMKEGRDLRALVTPKTSTSRPR